MATFVIQFQPDGTPTTIAVDAGAQGEPAQLPERNAVPAVTDEKHGHADAPRKHKSSEE